MGENDDVPVCAIGTAIDRELVRVMGRVVAADGELLTAPLTGRRCVAFDAAAFGYGTLGSYLHDDRTEHLITRSLRATPFVLEDDTGRAYVDPRGAFVRLTLDHEQGGPDQRIASLVVADRSFLPRSRATEDKRYVEGVLEIGDDVVVTGMVSRPRVGDASIYRTSADLRIHITSAPHRPADVTDRPDEIERAGGRPKPESGQRLRQHVSGRMIVVPDE